MLPISSRVTTQYRIITSSSVDPGVAETRRGYTCRAVAAQAGTGAKNVNDHTGIDVQEESAAAVEKFARLSWLPLTAGLACAVSLVVLWGWLAGEVYRGETLTFDISVRERVHDLSHPWMTAGMVTLSVIGSPLFLILLGCAFLLVALVKRWKRSAMIFIITMSGELALDLSLKATYARQRPSPYFGYALPDSFSFPSGHALGSLCFFGIITWLLTRDAANRTAAWVVRAAASVLIASIGFSRIYLGVHYPTDVLAGFLTGLMWTLTVITADYYFMRRRARRRDA
jgi:membrane-associated phospholipid phosphatase